MAIIGIATLECFIGICFLANRWMRLAVWLLVGELIGILSPIVLLPGRLFDGPHGAPTLEGQYVIKDIVVVAAAMVIAAGTFREGRMVRHEPAGSPPLAGDEDAADFNAKRKLEVVMTGVAPDSSIEQVCGLNGISEATFYEWRDAVLAGAERELEASPEPATARTA